MTASNEHHSTIVGGIDTHADTIHVAAIDALGRNLGDREFPTNARGYRAALEFLGDFGPITVIGIEGTSSYGAGITRTAHAAGIEIREVSRPNRAHRRMHGKSDPIDAYEAARAALAGRAQAAAKDERIQAIRALLNARTSAIKARTAAMNQIHQLLVTSPDPVREKYRDLKDRRLVDALASCRPSTQDGITRAVLTALKMIAQRHHFLSQQSSALEQQLAAHVNDANPYLLTLHGVGPISAAQLLITAGGNPERLRNEASFAALCGAAPVPASSGKTHRHRLSRGGDRAANRALHTIALVRMSHDPRTKTYARTQRERGRNPREILRQLKRAIAREVFKALTRTHDIPHLADLRPARRAKNITINAAARAMGTYPSKIVRTELGTYPDHDLAHRYRAWLTAA